MAKVNHNEIIVKDRVTIYRNTNGTFLTINDDSSNFFSLDRGTNNTIHLSIDTGSSIDPIYRISLLESGGRTSTASRSIYEIEADGDTYLNLYGDGTFTIDEVGNVDNGRLGIGLNYSAMTVPQGGIELAQTSTSSTLKYFILKRGANREYYIETHLDGSRGEVLFTTSLVDAAYRLELFEDGGAISDSKRAFDVLSDSQHYFTIYGDGKFLINNLGDFPNSVLGVGVAYSNISVDEGGIELKQRIASSNSFFIAKARNLDHGLTTYLPTDAYFQMEKISDISSNAGGGVKLTSVNTTDGSFALDAIIYDNSNGTNININLSRTDKNVNGAVTNIQSGHLGFHIQNVTNEMIRAYGDSSLILGSTTDYGKFGIGLSDYVDFTVDFQGIEIYQAQSTHHSTFVMRSKSVAHGVTDIVSTDTFGVISRGTSSGSTGGVSILGVGNSTETTGIEFKSIAVTPSTYTGSSNSAQGILDILALRTNGTVTRTDLADDQVAFSVSTDEGAFFYLLGDASIHTFGDNSAPSGIEVGAGGIQLHSNHINPMLAISGSAGFAHGITDFAEENTYFIIANNGGAVGGGRIDGFTSLTESLSFTGFFTTSDTTYATTSDAPISISVRLKSGTSASDAGSDDNMFVIKNKTTSRFLVKGDGSLFTLGSTTAPTAKAISSGGLHLHGETTDNLPFIALSLKDLAHGVTDIHPTDVYYSVSGNSSGRTYMQFTSEGNNSVVFRNIATGQDATLTLTSSSGVIIRNSIASGTGTTNYTTGNVLAVVNHSENAVVIKGDGSIYTFGSTAGNLSAPSTREVGGGGLHLHTDTSDALLAISDDGVTHGMTSTAGTDVIFRINRIDSANGGIELIGLADNTNTFVSPFKIIAKTSDSTVDSINTSAAYSLIQLVANKDTSEGLLDDDDNLFSVGNGDSRIGTDAVRFLIKGDGSIFTFPLGYSPSSKGIESGGIHIHTTGAMGNALLISATGVTHGMTGIGETDEYFSVGLIGNSTGGSLIRGMTEANVGVLIGGYATTSTTTTGMLSLGTIALTTSLKNGTAATSLADNDNVLSIANNSSTRFLIKGNGSIYTFGDGTGPDEDSIAGGGIHLHSDVDGTPLLVLSDEAVTHGFSSTVTGVDVFFLAQKLENDSGGVELIGLLSDDGADTASRTTAVRLIGKAQSGTTDTTMGTGGRGVVEIRGNNGSSTGLLASTENLLVVKNHQTAELILKGNGELYINDNSHSLGAGTTTVGYYDDYDDIKLAETARFMLGGWKNKIMKKNKEQLENLGIMKNGFISFQKMQALHLGTMGQLWNMIRHMGKQLGYNETKLLEMAKDYE